MGLGTGSDQVGLSFISFYSLTSFRVSDQIRGRVQVRVLFQVPVRIRVRVKVHVRVKGKV